MKLGRRNGIQCVQCFNNIIEAKRLARNGQVPMADGVRCDGKKELERIIDHLKGDVHDGTKKADDARRLWEAQSDRHPWVKVMKQHKAEVVKFLIQLAVDVHNDSMVKTLSAWSWPSRSLAQIHAQNIISQTSEHGLDAEFVPFSSTGVNLFYRNPNVYREMLKIVADDQLKQTTDSIRNADCFALQVDKSVDKHNVDGMYTTCRYMDPKTYEMNVCFLGESHSPLRGSEGLLCALKDRLEQCNLLSAAQSSMVGLSTDGENANTGRHSGLWMKTEQLLGREILTFWCMAHRSDLCLGYLESSVAEFQHWKSDAKAAATYFRGSSRRFEDLEIQAEVRN